MDRTYTDADGGQWSARTYDYLENTTPGHSKFYRVARVEGPHGGWEFVQWGRIGASPLSAQRVVNPDCGEASKKLREKRDKGYINTVDTEPAKFVWTSIVSAIKGRMLGDGAPLWTFEAVPPARLGADKI